MRTASTIEAAAAANQAEVREDAKSSTVNAKSASESKAQRYPASRLRGLIPYKPGQSGNPGGKPKHDTAAHIAREIFDQNPEMVYKAFAAALRKGNAYAFQVLADRGYGKLKEKIEVGGDAELVERLLAGRKRAAGR